MRPSPLRKRLPKYLLSSALILCCSRSARADDEAPSDADRCFALVKEGRALIKEDHIAEGLAKVKEAVDLGERSKLAPSDMADLLDSYGRYLHKAGNDEAAAAALRRAAALSPSSADIQLDLAQALSRIDENEDARRAAARSLELGITGDDAEDARATLKDAKGKILHERLQIGVSVGFGFDSNIQQSSQAQTIANRSTQSAAKSQSARVPLARDENLRLDFQVPRLYRGTVRSDYLGHAPAAHQWGLPLNLAFDVTGKLAGNRRTSLYLGYRIMQSLITVAEQGGSLLDKDGYSFQEQAVSLSLATGIPGVLDVKLRGEAYANASGLAHFTPFQYGVNAGLDVTVIESRMFRTKINCSHNFRNAFDQANDSQLNGNRDQVKVAEELRSRWIRLVLGYQFSHDATGAIDVVIPFFVGPDSSGVAGSPCPDPATDPTEKPLRDCIGNFTYHAPLSYRSHQGSIGVRLTLPKDIEISAGFRYERQHYLDDYYSTYTGIATVVTYPTPPDPKTPTFPVLSPSTNPALPTFEAGRQSRDDTRYGGDVRFDVELPRGFSIELAYSLLYNLSNIENVIDSRNFTKHTATVSASWGF